MQWNDKNDVVIWIDGKEVKVPFYTLHPVTKKPQITTIMQACEVAGVYIPHFCYHPKLSPVGVCRMCLVECGLPINGPDGKPLFEENGRPKIQKLSRPVTACTTPITPYMEIYTNTPYVKRLRAEVLEFLLINHPLDCPICDKAGECVLQEYVFEYGRLTSRFEDKKLSKPKAQQIGQYVILDAERCILCTRCIRFMSEIVRDDCLGIINRGVYNTITIWPPKQLNSNYSLNVVDLCPVGALTSIDFRFRMRTWFLKETKTICGKCARGCNIIVGSRENQIYRITPRRNTKVNDYWMCDEGRLSYKFLYSPTRILCPSINNKDDKWDCVIEYITSKIQKIPLGSVGIIVSTYLSCEELYVISKIAQRIGAITEAVPHMGEGDDFLIHEDKTPNTNGARLLGICFTEAGIQLPYIAEGIRAGKIKALIVIGEDVAHEEIVGLDLLRKLDFLVATSFEPNETTQLAHAVIPACSHFEKSGTYINADGRLQKFNQAVEPLGEIRAELEWLCKLLGLLGGPILSSNVRDIFNQIATEIDIFQGLTWEKIDEEGIQLISD